MLTFVLYTAPNWPFALADVGSRRWETAPTTSGVRPSAVRAERDSPPTGRRGKSTASAARRDVQDPARNSEKITRLNMKILLSNERPWGLAAIEFMRGEYREALSGAAGPKENASRPASGC